MLLTGILSFAVMLLGDINDISFRRKPLKLCFPAGVIALAGSVVVSCAGNNSGYPAAVRITFWAVAAISLALLIYSLFFAFPTKEAYVRTDGKREVCDRGIYALCRHPGVIWFAFLMFSLCFSAGLPLLNAAVLSAENLAYAALQDIYFFPKLLEGYAGYKKKAPFIIPSIQSIKRCIAYVRGKEELR